MGCVCHLSNCLRLTALVQSTSRACSAALNGQLAGQDPAVLVVLSSGVPAILHPTMPCATTILASRSCGRDREVCFQYRRMRVDGSDKSIAHCQHLCHYFTHNTQHFAAVTAGKEVESVGFLPTASFSETKEGRELEV
jgi:hypothetical protein